MPCKQKFWDMKKIYKILNSFDCAIFLERIKKVKSIFANDGKGNMQTR